MAYPPKEYSYNEYLNLLISGKWPYSKLDENKIYYLPKVYSDKILFKEDPEPISNELEYQTTIALFPPNYNIESSQPIVTINTTLTKQGRLFFLKEKPQFGPVELEIDVYGEFDEQNNRPVIFPSRREGDTTLENLPLGTVLTWTVFTESYSAVTDGNIYEKNTYYGTYLDFGENQPIFPEEQPFTVFTTVDEIVYRKYTIIGHDIDNNILVNESYDPIEYDVSGFTVVTFFERE